MGHKAIKGSFSSNYQFGRSRGTNFSKPRVIYQLYGKTGYVAAKCYHRFEVHFLGYSQNQVFRIKQRMNLLGHKASLNNLKTHICNNLTLIILHLHLIIHQKWKKYNPL